MKNTDGQQDYCILRVAEESEMSLDLRKVLEYGYAERDFRIGRSRRGDKLKFIIPAIDEAVEELKTIAESGKNITFLFGETDDTSREVLCVEKKRYALYNMKMRKEYLYSTTPEEAKNSMTYEEFNKCSLTECYFEKVGELFIVNPNHRPLPMIKLTLTLEIIKRELNDKKDLENFKNMLNEINSISE